MHNNQQTIQEWNLNFLEEHLDRISHQNKYKEIDPINLVDERSINILYKDLTSPENIKLIQNGQYPTIETEIKLWSDLQSSCFNCKSKETKNNYIIEINHYKSKIIKTVCNDPYTYNENKYKHIITFDKNKYQIQLETQIIPLGSNTLQPSTKRTFTQINNKTDITEWERLANIKGNKHSLDEEQYIKSIIKPSKILNSAIKNNYFYDHWIYPLKGKDFLRIEVGSVIHYSYANINEKGEIKYRINVYPTPEEIKIYKDLYSNNSKKYEQHYYNSYEEFYDDVAILKEDAELLQVLENDIRKIEELQLCASFNGQNKEKAPQKVYNN